MEFNEERESTEEDCEQDEEIDISTRKVQKTIIILEINGEDLLANYKSEHRGIARRSPRRKNSSIAKENLKSPQKLWKPRNGFKKVGPQINGKKWTNEALKLAIEGINQGYRINEVSKKYGIPRSFLRDHMEGRTRGRRMGPKICFKPF